MDLFAKINDFYAFKIKKMNKYILLLCFYLGLQLAGNTQQFPSKENNCFQYFDEGAIGGKDVNAYLLGYLSRIVYVQYLNKDNGYNLRLTDTSKFRDKFIERTRHFFPASTNLKKADLLKTGSKIPSLSNKNIITSATDKSGLIKAGITTYKWIWRSDGVGKNPEAMFISTPDYILVELRGTDKVEGADPFHTEWGEWIFTDFDILKQKRILEIRHWLEYGNTQKC